MRKSVNPTWSTGLADRKKLSEAMKNKVTAPKLRPQGFAVGVRVAEGNFKAEAKAKPTACKFKQSLHFLNYISSLISYLQKSIG